MGIAQIRSQYALNAGIQKMFWDKEAAKEFFSPFSAAGKTALYKFPR